MLHKKKLREVEIDKIVNTSRSNTILVNIPSGIIFQAKWKGRKEKKRLSLRIGETLLQDGTTKSTTQEEESSIKPIITKILPSFIYGDKTIITSGILTWGISKEWTQSKGKWKRKKVIPNRVNVDPAFAVTKSPWIILKNRLVEEDLNRVLYMNQIQDSICDLSIRFTYKSIIGNLFDSVSPVKRKNVCMIYIDKGSQRVTLPWADTFLIVEDMMITEK